MIQANTDIENIVVEIEDEEYPLLPKTVDIEEKLLAAEKENLGKPAYKLWLAEIRILLGDTAYNKLFHSGKNENVDRIHSIFHAVVKAFNYHDEVIEGEDLERRIQGVATALGPINELLRQVNAYNKGQGAKK